METIPHAYQDMPHTYIINDIEDNFVFALSGDFQLDFLLEKLGINVHRVIM